MTNPQRVLRRPWAKRLAASLAPELVQELARTVQDLARVEGESASLRDWYKNATENVAQLRADLDGYRTALFKATNEAARLRDDRNLLGEKLRQVTLAGQPEGATPRISSTLTARSSLRFICVGTGRDGTTSLARMIEEILDGQGHGGSVMHEWASVELNASFCDWAESSDPQHLQRIREIIQDCPHTCIVGNGYAAILPTIADLFGREIGIVHLRRRDRQACIESLALNADLYPVNHRYYAQGPEATGKRLAAFHFNEMPRDAWDSATLRARFGWYYDKTHTLISEHLHRFDRTLGIETESLVEPTTRAALAAFMGSETLPQAVHLNQHVQLEDAPLVQRQFFQRLLGKLDTERLTRDDLYGLRHVVEEYTRYLTERASEVDRGDDIGRQVLGTTLASARLLLDGAGAVVKGLEGNLRSTA